MKLIAFPFHDWRKAEQEGFRTRDLHVFEWLLRDQACESLLVVDRPVSRAERLLRRAPWRVQGDVVAEATFRGTRACITQVHERGFVLDQATPHVVGPLARGRGWWFDTFTDSRTLAAIGWAARCHGVDAGIAWLPTVWPALESLALPFVFDSLDNLLIHPTYRRWKAESEAAYAHLLPAALEVFAAARANADVLGRWRDDVVLLPNGVDPEHFVQPVPRPSDLPDSPVVGYVGKLGGRLDAPLIEAVARRLPDVEFVFVGPVLEGGPIGPLRSQPNVRLLGDRGYASVPAYMRHFDIAWIPHRVGEGETGGDLIKRYEYWAAGRDVISTRIDGMGVLEGQLALIDTPDDAVQAITGLLDGRFKLPTPQIPAERTWRAISKRLVSSLQRVSS